MQITIDTLLGLRLSPNALAVALYVMRNARSDGRSNARTVDMSEEFGLSDKTTQRAVTELITAGFMTREVRGVYRICVTEDASPVTEETSPMTETTPVYKSHKPIAIAKTATQSLGRERPESLKGITLRTYDDGDDLGGVGLTEPRKPQTKSSRRSVPNLHRNIPREDWSMETVVKEFKHRMFLWRRATGKDPIGDQVGKLIIALAKWKSDYGLTPQEAADLCDRFFDDPLQTARISDEVPAYRLYLHFIKMNVDSLRKAEISDDLVAYVAGQDLPW